MDKCEMFRRRALPVVKKNMKPFDTPIERIFPSIMHAYRDAEREGYTKSYSTFYEKIKRDGVYVGWKKYTI